jgi:hypothetical protein
MSWPVDDERVNYRLEKLQTTKNKQIQWFNKNQRLTYIACQQEMSHEIEWRRKTKKVFFVRLVNQNSDVKLIFISSVSFFLPHFISCPSGGIVANSDYAQRPHCFDTCHLASGVLQQHSVLSSTSASVHQLMTNFVTTPQCFDIELLSTSDTDQSFSSSSSQFVNESIFDSSKNLSLPSSSAISLRSLSSSSCSFLVISSMFIHVLQRISQEFSWRKKRVRLCVVLSSS